MKRLGFFLLVICFGLMGSPIVYAQQSTKVVPPPDSVNLKPELKRFNATITGEVIWKGHNLKQTNVSVYRDEKLKDLYTSGISQKGKFALRVEPGKYYLVAYVDVDESGKFDEGDAYGVLGVKDWQDENQKHQEVDIGSNANLKGIEIPITARLQRIKEELKLIPATLYQPSEFKKFSTELSQATSGVRGTLKFTQQELPKVPMLVIAYTDTSWKYQAAIDIVDPKTTEWELRLMPGKYYLMAVVDRNRSNRLDNGDQFGFYGVIDIHKRGAFPKPVLIKRHNFTENLTIEVSTTYTKNLTTMNREKIALVSGRIMPRPQNASKIQVEVYLTSALVNPIATVMTDADGQFRVKLPVGEYYLIANHDVDENGTYSEGDKLGGFGTDSIATNPPTSLVIEEGETRAVYIKMSAHYDSEGQLVQIPDAENQLISGNFGPVENDESINTGQMGSITGKIISYFSNDLSKLEKEDSSENNEPSPDGLLSLSITPDFRNPMWMPLFIDEDGTFLVDVKPGKYYVMAVVDQNSDGRSGLSDGIGIFGTHQPVRGNPAAITVFPGKTTPHVDIDILASYVDEKGTISELTDGDRWNIARMYGEPEDIFKYTDKGKLIEEWMYWTRGLAFQFEGDGAGWKLKDRDKFEPNTQNISGVTEKTKPDNPDVDDKSDEKTNENISIDGFSLATESVFIFYSHEGVLWRIAPATFSDTLIDTVDVKQPSVQVDTRVAPLGLGFHPSVTENGALVYHDLNNNVIIRDITSKRSKVLLDNRHLAEDVSISPDGEYIAYSNTGNSGRKRIVIQHLRSEKIYPIPSTSLEMSSPAWGRDGRLLAYAAAGTIENPQAGGNRNIYAFDNVSNRVEPIVISPEDDAEPSWHPIDQNTLAFSRGTGDNTRQIWIVTFSSNGKPIEEKITDMGGSHPVWVPPNGRWILYENNGQLWTVDTTTPESESPLISNGQAVFGYQPIAMFKSETPQ